MKPDLTAAYEVRQVDGKPWIYEIWDVTHPASCNHFPFVRVDSKGAADDYHEQVANTILTALRAQTAGEGGVERVAKAICCEGHPCAAERDGNKCSAVEHWSEEARAAIAALDTHQQENGDE